MLWKHREHDGKYLHNTATKTHKLRTWESNQMQRQKDKRHVRTQETHNQKPLPQQDQDG